MDNELLVHRIIKLLEMINEVMDDLSDKTLESFQKSNLYMRAVSFSMMQIGETMNKLESILRADYPDVPWKHARDLRNLIVHDYGKVDAETVFFIVKNDLPELKEAFIVIKEDLIAKYQIPC